MQALASQWAILEQRGLLVWFPSAATINGWPEPFNPPWNWWLSQHLPSFCIPWCQPWPFNGPFWNSVWLLVWFPSAATIKWLTSTFQPTMKLVIEPASAILLHFWILLPMPPNASPGLSMGYFGTAWATCMISKCCHYKMAGLNLSTHHEIGDWASPKSSHYQMASFNPPPRFEMGDGVEYPAFQAISTQKGGRCWLNHRFHGGLKGWGQPFYSGSTWKSYK